MPSVLSIIEDLFSMPSFEESSSNFERIYAQVRTPLPVKAHHVSLEAARLLSTSLLPQHFYTIVAQLAISSDIDSLENILEAGVDVLNLDAYRNYGVPYLVAHMLVDNSGNEAFARRWIEAFGHTQADAVKHYLSSGWNSAAIGPRQHQLGMAQLCDICKLLPNGKSPLQKWLDDVRYAPEDHKMLFVEHLAMHLRIQHPLDPPKVNAVLPGREQILPMPQFLLSSHMENWHNVDVHRALAWAYPEPSLGILYEIRRALIDVIDKGWFTPAGNQWEAIDAWGTPGICAKLWNASTLSNNHMFVELCNLGIQAAASRLTDLRGMGVDLQTPSITVEGRRYRLLEVAVEMNNPDLAGWLIAQGCDPQLRTLACDKNQHEAWLISRGRNEQMDPDDLVKTTSALDIANDVVALRVSDTDERERFQRLQAILKSCVARQAALTAIDDVNTPVASSDGLVAACKGP